MIKNETGLEQVAYLGLLAFLVVLYSNIAVVVPALAPLQPAKIIALLALGALVAGRLARDAGLRLDDPQTILVFGLAILAAASVYGALWPGLAIEWGLDFLKMIAVYLLIVHVVHDPARFRRVAATLVVCSLVPALLTIRRAVTGVSLVEGSRAAWVGFFGDPNELAYSLVILVPLTVTLLALTRSRAARAALAFAGVIQVAAVVATQSRGGLLGLIVVVWLIMWRYKTRADVLVAAGVLALLAAVLASEALWNRLERVATYQLDGAITGRLEAWRIGWSIFVDRWGWGVGIGNFPLAWPLYADTPTGKWITAHNAFIQILGELGVAGLLAFVALLAATVIGLRRTRRAAAQAGAAELESCAAGLEIALWGYLTCSMLLSVAFNWFFYLILGLSVAVIAMAPRAGDPPLCLSNIVGRARPWG